jgi:DNA-binding NtrC family response regulator
MSVLRLRSQLARAAPDVSPALIIGETGTGKESIARELHRLSGRKGDFVAVNCATFGEQLIESQLFGHVKGAFTGATTDQEGLFVAAQGGTLFLDEIGEMPLELQPKLLRAIQEREIRAVGSTRNVKVDVRIVAATHRDLVERARLGTFRQDLYARLALWQLQVPALRERRADVVRWARFLHAVWCEERKLSSDPGLDLHPDAAEALALLAWPENLRGMNRLVHEVAVLRLREPLRREHLPDWVRREHAAILREERA